jgi:hypothetical protein
VSEDTPATPIYEATIESKPGRIVKSGFLVKKGKVNKHMQQQRLGKWLTF